MKRPIKSQSGNVLFYILVAVALLGMLSYVMTRGSGENVTATQANQFAEQVKSQAQLIRSAILECNLVHGFGYPPEPVSNLVEDLECQVDSGGTTEPVFGGGSGRFLPPPPSSFLPWMYHIDTSTNPDSIFIEMSGAFDCTGDMAFSTAFNILSSQFSTAEIAGSVCNGVLGRFRLNIVTGS